MQGTTPLHICRTQQPQGSTSLLSCRTNYLQGSTPLLSCRAQRFARGGGGRTVKTITIVFFP